MNDGSRDLEDAAALAELEDLLRKRVEHFKAGGISERTVSEIFEQALREHDRGLK